jgi:UrcA family protein
MNTVFHRLLPAIFLAGAMFAVAPYACADDAKPAPSLTPSVTVHFADLNPSSPEGVRALYGRITNAAETVCGTKLSVWDFSGLRHWKTCYRATIDHAVRQINRPELTALHQKTMGKGAGLDLLSAANPPQR